MSNLYTRQLELSEGPWRIQDRHRLTVVDPLDRTICVVKDNSAIPVEQRLANAHCIAAAPELLAALKEATFLLHSMNINTDGAIVDLLLRAAPDDTQIHEWANQVPSGKDARLRKLRDGSLLAHGSNPVRPKP
jgi:hypothetical protein